MSRLRKAASVGSIADGLWGRLDRTGQGATRARAVSAWRAVAGEEVAAHARGFALRDQELLVFVDSAVWANELSVLSEHYRTAVNERLGKELVTSIRFAVSRKVAEVQSQEAEDESRSSAGAFEKVRPVEATETEIAQVRQMAAAVSDPELREAVIAAALAHLAWRKGIEAHSVAERAVQRATGADSHPVP
jgi:hypothetical protein